MISRIKNKWSAIVYVVLILALLMLGIWYFYIRCKPEKQTCPDKSISYFEPCAKEHFKDFAEEYELDFEFDGESIISSLGVESASVKTKIKELHESYTQEFRLLFNSLKMSYLNANRNPCNKELLVEVRNMQNIVMQFVSDGKETKEEIKSTNKSKLEPVINSNIQKLKSRIPIYEKAMEKSEFNKDLIAQVARPSIKQYSGQLSELVKNTDNAFISNSLKLKDSPNIEVAYYDEASKSNAQRLAEQIKMETGLVAEIRHEAIKAELIKAENWRRSAVAVKVN